MYSVLVFVCACLLSVAISQTCESLGVTTREQTIDSQLYWISPNWVAPESGAYKVCRRYVLLTKRLYLLGLEWDRCIDLLTLVPLGRRCLLMAEYVKSFNLQVRTLFPARNLTYKTTKE